ncbi:hypothetical protein B0O99DRAFT_663124 [Bisporella sp. PMI_857]|nr:hypothetical protein B0O99DRAFT_663124 [Bisporella sp. PMI_857]
MANASGGRASIVTAGSSSFGQYRLTQFAGPNANDATEHLVSSHHRDKPQMAQSSRPSSGQNIDRTPSIAPARSAPQDLNQVEGSPGFGTLELVEVATNPILEGVLGPNKDGRVRNPVPSKLKGKTDNKQGNFGVMHMGMSPGKTKDISGKDIASERDAAARRTSENTASRAKAAQQEKYAPPKRRGLEAMDNRGSPFGDPRSQRPSRPLAPDETKFEQARLLTLLRSINPVTVVDQICKALAYFGGIPGAPPPEDGIFPESANTRETGALFVGWIAEIFPDLSSPEVPKMQAPPAKKAKGRPSKAEPNATSTNEAPNPRNGYGYGQAVGAPTWGLPQSLALVNTPDVSLAVNSAIPQNVQPVQRPATPPKNHHPEDNGGMSTGKRGRGRPKGSRNKGGKDNPTSANEEAGYGIMGGPHQATSLEQQQSSPVLEKNSQSETVAYTSMERPAPNASQNITQAKTQAEQEWQINNQKKILDPQVRAAVAPMGDELSPEEQAVLRAFRAPDVAQASPVPTAVAAPGKTAQAGGVKRKRGPNKPKVNTVPSTTVQAQQGQSNSGMTQPTNSMGQNNYTMLQNTNAAGQNTSAMNHAAGQNNTLNQSSTAISMPNNNIGGTFKEAGQWAPVDTSTSAVPATKRQRQRKPKVTAPAGTESPSLSLNNSLSKPSSVGGATPIVQPSTIPDSTATSSQQSIPVTRPPAEGLEAHYERFANPPQQSVTQQTLPQQNGRSHTPSITPQQQLRNQQKTASVPPQTQQLHQSPAQQSTSLQQQHQHQMQQQKSQQGSQREDQKAAQGTTSRSSSSSGFYSQRNQTNNTYSQQYPTHQPTQLYGHQPSLSQGSLTQSPQMNSGNSYRTASTHTLGQGSQFSQPENTYRTATYTQPDTSNYRTSSSNTLAQSSSAYSENSYRTPSTHSLSTNQSHYNNFADNPYVDLPTLESLGHGGTSNSASVGMGTGSYGQGIGLGNTSSSRSGSNSLYGTTSSTNSVFDTGTNDILRAAPRTSGSSNAYGAGSTMNNFNLQQDQMMRNLGGRR